jgi:uncharacterized membrane protein
MITLVQKYLDKSHYSDLKNDFEDLFLSHPNYPSVFAITDSLDTLSVENIALKVPKEQLTVLPDFFMAFYSDNLVLVHKSEKGIDVNNTKGEKQHLSFNEFLTHWNGVIIAIEPNVIINTKNGKINIKWLSYILPLLVLIASSIVYNSYSLNNVLLLFTAVIGLIVSIFIIQEKLGIKNEMVSKLCNINPNTSCDSVIKSSNKGQNKWIHFSDLPLLYFGISVLSIIIQPKHSSVIVGFLSLFSIPILLYSVWLQKFQLKKWCVLCLTVSCIVFIQSLIFGFSNLSFPNILSIDFFGFLFSTVLFASVWVFIKPVMENKIKIEKDVNEAKKFKRNYKLFQFLTNEIPVLKGFNQLEGLHFGNKNADLQLTIIISPSCGHCHKAFEDAFELVSKFPERVSLNVLFNINPENDDNPYKAVVESLLAINNHNSENAKRAIFDWHIKKMELNQWKEKWTLNVIDMKVNHQIHQQYNWCSENEFNYTPVKIINDKLFPKEYDINELKYFLNDFSEEKETTANDILAQA